MANALQVRTSGGETVRVAYEAAHAIDAHLVRHALDAAGIPAFILGEALLGGLGELGIYGLVSVWVPDPCWPQARSVIESLRLGDPRDEREPHPQSEALPMPDTQAGWT